MSQGSMKNKPLAKAVNLMRKSAHTIAVSTTILDIFNKEASNV